VSATIDDGLAFAALEVANVSDQAIIDTHATCKCRRTRAIDNFDIRNEEARRTR